MKLSKKRNLGLIIKKQRSLISKNRWVLALRARFFRTKFKKKYRLQLQKYFANMTIRGLKYDKLTIPEFSYWMAYNSESCWLWVTTSALNEPMWSGISKKNVVFNALKPLCTQTLSKNFWLSSNQKYNSTGFIGNFVNLYYSSYLHLTNRMRFLLGFGWTPNNGNEPFLRRLQSGVRWFRLVRNITRRVKVVVRRRRRFYRLRRFRRKLPKIRTPQWFWWRARPRWHGYWLIKRKWKFQKKFIPIRKMKFSVTLRRAKWVFHARRVARYTQFRNPSRGRWWRLAATYPKRRKYISAGMLRRRLFRERTNAPRHSFPFFNWIYFMNLDGLFDFGETKPEEDETSVEIKNTFFMSDGTEVEDWTKGRPDELTPDDIFNEWFSELEKVYKKELMPIDDKLSVYQYMSAGLENFDKFDIWCLSFYRSNFFRSTPWTVEYIEPKWMKDLAKPKTVTYMYNSKPYRKKRRFCFNF